MQATHLSDEVAGQLWDEAGEAGVPFMTRVAMGLFMVYLRRYGVDAPYDVNLLVRLSGLPPARTRQALRELALSPWPERAREELRAALEAL